jgi:predicted adenine nucleotide alpha hydrolase (AANH) superfamily ATPase
MKLLLHVCCAPCSIYPVRILREEKCDVMGFFYGSNIHPYTECLKRRKTLSDYAETIDLRLIISEAYDLEPFLRNVVYREKERCLFCYQERLRSTALMAKRGKFDAFSTTLLYSKFQQHETIRSIGHSVGQDVGISFLYQDFRTGWKEGVERSKQLKMYRQQYCGCIYSEKERYFNNR